MKGLTLYPVFIATLVSIVGLSRLAIREHDHSSPHTLSELAAAEQSLLVHFRNILIFCGVLFAITLFGFVTPRIAYGLWTGVFGILMVIGELSVSVMPARDKTKLAHTIMAQVMAVGMLGLAVIFWFSLHGGYADIEAALVSLMCITGLLTYFDKRHFILHELLFIFASHFSIVTAAIALSTL